MLRKTVAMLLAIAIALSTTAFAVAEDGAPTCTTFAIVGEAAYLMDGEGKLWKRPLDAESYEPVGAAVNTVQMEAPQVAALDPDAVTLDWLFELDGALYGCCTKNGAWYRLTDGAGAFAPEKQPVALQFGAEESAVGTYVVSALFQQNGWLYMCGRDYAAGNRTKAVRVSLATGERKELTTPMLYMIAPYAGDELLCYLYDMSASNPAMMEDGETVQFAIIDAATGDVKRTWDVVIDGLLGGFSVGGICASDSTLYYKAGSRVYGMDMATGESRVSAYTGEGLVSGAGGSGQIAYTNGCYVYVAQNALRLLPLDTEAVKAGALRIFGEFGTVAHTSFVNAHPEIPVDVSGDYTADIEKLTQAMLSENDTYDVLVMSLNTMPVERLINKGYCTPLDGYPQIVEAVASMLPKYAEAGKSNGTLYAVPVELAANCMSINAQLWEQLGLTEDDIPTNYLELFDFAENWMYDYGEDNPDIPLFNYGGADMLIYSLLLTDYMNYIVAKNGNLRFDTPEYRKLMEAFKAVDFEDIGLAAGEQFTLSYMPQGLINIVQAVSSPRLLNDEWLLMPLACVPDSEPLIGATLSVMVINPKTKRMDAAAQYVSHYATHLSKSDAYITLYPEHNEPVINADVQQTIETTQQAIADAETRLAAAGDEAKASLRAEIESMNASLAEMQKKLYTVTEEQIARFRDVVEPLLYVSSQNTLLGAGEAAIGEINTLLLQYIGDAISLDALVREIDGRLALMEMEDR